MTEFGYSTPAHAAQSQLPRMDIVRYDMARSDYYISALAEISKSIWEDGVDVLGALAWTFVDDYETGTFEKLFGLQGVNRTTQERFYKRSFFDVIDFVESRRETLHVN